MPLLRLPDVGGTEPTNSELKLLRQELEDREARKPGLLIVFGPAEPDEDEPLSRDEDRQPPP